MLRLANLEGYRCQVLWGQPAACAQEKGSIRSLASHSIAIWVIKVMLQQRTEKWYPSMP